MKKAELAREGKKWVAEGIISEEQLEKILGRGQDENPNPIIILLAVLLTGLGFLTFIMSDWAREPHISRVIIIIAVTLFLYLLGDFLSRKREDLYGISFIVLGYVVFGAGLLLIIDIYNISVYSSWPFVIWSIVGLVLYYIYHHVLIFAVAIIVNTVGQIYSGAGFSELNWLMTLLFILGFGYFVYKNKNYLLSYLFGLGYVIQMIVLATAEFDQYYYYLMLILPLYLVSTLIQESSIRLPLKYVSIGAIFIFAMFQTFMLQESWLYEEVTLEWGFFITWLILFIVGIALKWWSKNLEEVIDFALFLPVIFLPFSYILSLIILFIFSLSWIFVGYLKNTQQYILLGTTAFLFSTFITYIQFAWDTIDRSLFFFVGGILLFLISIIIEKQRRKLATARKGSGVK